MGAMVSQILMIFLLNRLFKAQIKETSKLRVTGLCEGNSPVTGKFPAQRASNAENVSIWWHHNDYHTVRLLFTFRGLWFLITSSAFMAYK